MKLLLCFALGFGGGLVLRMLHVRWYISLPILIVFAFLLADKMTYGKWGETPWGRLF